VLIVNVEEDMYDNDVAEYLGHAGECNRNRPVIRRIAGESLGRDMPLELARKIRPSPFSSREAKEMHACQRPNEPVWIRRDDIPCVKARSVNPHKLHEFHCYIIAKTPRGYSAVLQRGIEPLNRINKRPMLHPRVQVHWRLRV
jgi:hypothetical protein